ncbi:MULTISPECIES: hypothetical protein [Moorena]|uniref:Uncharacterized protein n=1 Tax=Moorena producens PAL-8-15-08-1 TaxID=1458985 RepID=A0A1D8TNX4_9CYAN|nr:MULTISPECIES: hypothetical protein [Moorena]AOW99316.1 hypothetical protein BJP34_07455 [Moorena producens PAL-8-15-08-1]NEO73405.1 hypothetical protein [Moorena sp. SIO3H5]
MSDPNREMEMRSAQPLAEQPVQDQVDQAKTEARKEEVIDIYEDLLTTIWDRIMPTLGRVTVVSIMERSLALTAEKYPLIGYIESSAEGVSFEVFRKKVSPEQRLLIREALKELVTTLIDILAILTGDILVRQLLKEIEGKKLI